MDGSSLTKAEPDWIQAESSLTKDGPDWIQDDPDRMLGGSSSTKDEADWIQDESHWMLGGSSLTKAEADWIQGEPDRMLGGSSSTKAESAMVVAGAGFTGLLHWAIGPQISPMDADFFILNRRNQRNRRIKLWLNNRLNAANLSFTLATRRKPPTRSSFIKEMGDKL